MHINPHTIFPILCIPLALTCGFFVLLNNYKERLNQLFFFMCLDMAVWFSFYIPANFSVSDQFLFSWYRISMCFISFLPIMLFTFVTTYLNVKNNQFWYKINSSIGFTFCMMSLFTNWIIKGINHFSWYPYPQAGILHALLVLHCAYLALYCIKLIHTTLKEPSLDLKRKNHLKYLFSAIICLSFGISDFIANYGIPIYHIGYATSTIFLILVTVAIVKYQLLDIQIVLRKSLLYSSLIFIIAFFYFISIYITEHAVQNIFKYHSVFISLLLATIIAIAFIPIKNFLEKYLFHKNLGLIAEENDSLRKEIEQTERYKIAAALSSGLAHEIKNPLTSLSVFTEYLNEKKNDPEFLEQYQKLAKDEIGRINDLLQELLDFSKPSLPQMQQVKPNEIITQTLNLVKQRCAANKIDVETKLQANTYISADPNQLKQAILNIILNAIDAMPTGGILEIGTQNDNQYLIEISDTGSGINLKDLPHIFEPFYTKKEKGTGLGLAITQGIIEKHGGKIIVENKLNKGTRFLIKF